MASLAGLVEQDPDFIRNSLKDNNDGTVTVRLFNEGRPFYIRVEKTIPKNERGASIYAKGCLWAQMIEKAFVVSGLKRKYMDSAPDKQKFDQQTKKGQRSYESISAGDAKDAMYILTGKNAENRLVDEDLKMNNQHEKIGKDRRLFLDDGSIEFDGNMERLMNDALSELEDARQNKRIIVAATRTSFIQSTGKSSESGKGSEKDERGFSSMHGYTVLGVERKNGIPYVRLRNAWGHNNAETYRNPLTGVISYRAAPDDRFGSFVVDLKTYVTYYSHISVGKTRRS